MTLLPEALYHYFEADQGPFHSLSMLPPAQAEQVLESIRREGLTFASRRAPDYLTIRSELEERVRGLFLSKGGQPQLRAPHYFTLGECPWLMDWYKQGRVVSIPLCEFEPHSLSFTYGDTFPAFRYPDGKPYRGKVYTLAELPEIVRTFGLPQVWNAAGKHGPDRYIEAQVWDAVVLRQHGYWIDQGEGLKEPG